MLSLVRFFFLIGLLSGCGFQPMYAPHHGTSEELTKIKINVIADRTGQMLRNKLSQNFTPHGHTSAHPLYALDVRVTETRSDISFRKDATSRRAQITMVAHYSLKSLDTQKIVTAGTVEEISGFSIGSQADFASLPAVVSEKNTRERLIEALAQEITLQLAGYFIEKQG